MSVSVSASAQIFLEEGKIKHDVIPGENIAGKLTIHNTSGQSQSARVYWEDFTYLPPFHGSKEFLPKGTTDNSIADWVNVSFQTLTLGPFSSKTISYTINVPDEINFGHQGVLFFEKEAVQAAGEKGLNVVTRVGCLFFIEPKNKTIKVGMQNFHFAGQELIVDFLNQGNVMVIPEGTFYVIDQEGMVFDRGEMEKIYLPPDATAEYKMTVNSGLNPGTYTMVMTVSMEDEVIVKEIDFKNNFSSSFDIIEIRD